MPDEKGETRRERNERLKSPTPQFRIPQSAHYIWNWFKEISDIASPIREGFYRRIPPSEYLAWQQLTGNIVYPEEYDILFAMDGVFCDEMNAEIQAREAIRQERLEKERELNSRKR
jgi:hypothetical protein